MKNSSKSIPNYHENAKGAKNIFRILFYRMSRVTIINRSFFLTPKKCKKLK